MASSYVVLARKYRSAQFSDIVGQGHIVRTLMNAIRSGRIHQAYLFTGSRGIGKTSIARIFAKALRCENTSWTEGDPGWLVTCDQCASCKEVAVGNGADVLEIDGASNNGVDHIRELRENARYLPAVGSRKIYIIDEVHMLTTAAFNALLKTLEEPPPHVVFILATTEPHKIPATILSRCQRFDFRRHTLAQIQSRLTEITRSEGIDAEQGALALIGRAAEGGMRDALSLLDQVIAFCGNKITTQSVRDSIGLIEGQTILGVLEGILARKPLDALEQVKQAYQQGHDLKVLTRSLIEFLHAAILAKVGAPSQMALEVAEEEWKSLTRLASLRDLEEMEMIFQALHYGLEWVAHSPQPKVVLDILLVKCATAEALVFAGAEASGSLSDVSASVAPPSAAPARPLPQSFAVSAPAAPRATSAVSPAPAAQPVSVAPAAPAAPRIPEGPRTWEGFIDFVRTSRPLLASTLEHGACGGLPTQGDPSLKIIFPPEGTYFRDQVQSRVYADQLMALAKEYYGFVVRPQVALRAANEQGISHESLAEKREREAKEREANARSQAQSNPVLMEARSLFGGEMGPIEILESGGGAHA